MSDTPRLTRKQLRELGKLEVKSPDAPSLTDTQELRLRRPSRKELREAEKLRATARAAAEAPEKLERKSVFSRFQSEDGEVETPANTVNGESPVITAEEPVVVQPAAVEELNEKAESTAAPEKEPDKKAAVDTEVDAAADADIDLDAALAADADDAAPRSLRERLVMRTRRDKIKASESPAAAEVSAEEISGEEISGEEAEAAAPEVQSEKVESDSALTAQDENSADENLEVAATEKNAAAEEVEAAELAEAGKLIEPAELAEKIDTKAAAASAEKATEIKSEKSDKEKKVNRGGERSSRRAWFVLFILIAIGIIVGYLGGSLINLFFFSAAGEISDFTMSTALLL